MEEASLHITRKYLFITITIDKHEVPPTKRLFKVAMLDDPKLLGPWGMSGGSGTTKFCCHMDKLGFSDGPLQRVLRSLPEKIFNLGFKRGLDLLTLKTRDFDTWSHGFSLFSHL
ncbi:hypothetical protein Tco_0988751 [Tanacetum coccineum]|uniref:Uncharacterized protein n=1 Tax=Tanacetum coccineum TaxID=301880 RepID=A0ABQ5ET66_9ASTR